MHAYKPRGLWVSDESDYGWRQWCEDNQYSCGKFAYPVQLASHHNILIISSVKELIEFTETFLYDHQWMQQIDWYRVAKQYDGILISPYLGTFGPDNHLNWYYGWDCASGCIWNPHSITLGKEMLCEHDCFRHHNNDMDDMEY